MHTRGHTRKRLRHLPWRTAGDELLRVVPAVPQVSAVVTAWAHSPPLGDCLRSVRRAERYLEGAVEIVVVDNGHVQDHPDELDGLWDHWIESPRNLGPSRGRNLGARAASAAIVAFIDDDATVDPAYFQNALPYFGDPSVVGLRGRVRSRRHPLYTAVASHYDRGPVVVDDALITEGASLLRRRAFLEAGGFPENVDGHEGIELTYRLLRHSPDDSTLYAPDVVLEHDYAVSLPDFVQKSIRHALSRVDIRNRQPDAAQYLEDYFDRSFPGSPTPSAPYRLVRAGLRCLRTGLRLCAKWTSGLLAQERRPST